MNVNCFYCQNEMNRTKTNTPYGVFTGFKCPVCDFAFSSPTNHPEDVTLYHPNEQKLKTALRAAK